MHFLFSLRAFEFEKLYNSRSREATYFLNVSVVFCNAVPNKGFHLRVLFSFFADPIPYAATAEKVESALELVVPDVEVAGDVREGYEVTFTGNLGASDNCSQNSFCSNEIVRKSFIPMPFVLGNKP